MAVIRSFAVKETQKVFNGEHSYRLPVEIQERAQMRLERIHAAITLDDLRVPPSHHLEALKGKRKGQYSIRINGQWRVCFKWREGHASEVEIVDYH